MDIRCIHDIFKMLLKTIHFKCSQSLYLTIKFHSLITYGDTGNHYLMLDRMKKKYKKTANANLIATRSQKRQNCDS